MRWRSLPICSKNDKINVRQKNTPNDSLIFTLGFTIFLILWLQFISLLNFMRLLFKGGIYFFGKSTGKKTITPVWLRIPKLLRTFLNFEKIFIISAYFLSLVRKVWNNSTPLPLFNACILHLYFRNINLYCPNFLGKF